MRSTARQQAAQRLAAYRLAAAQGPASYPSRGCRALQPAPIHPVLAIGRALLGMPQQMETIVVKADGEDVDWAAATAWGRRD